MLLFTSDNLPDTRETPVFFQIEMSGYKKIKKIISKIGISR